MEFRTQIPIAPKEPKIRYDSGVLLLGSCFVENIGNKLEYYKFQNLVNPFGILFHPAAIANFLERVGRHREFTADDVFFHNERWHCFQAHSDLSGEDRQKVLQALNQKTTETLTFIKEASHVIITPGTAWGYALKETGRIVANCHKLPQDVFRKELSSVQQPLQACVDMIREINPEAVVIFTVSPVRHLKDGFVENQRSKAKLISAVHDIMDTNENVHYFPSYEIMMDELRDYRFYSEDMLHPNSTAVNYIWDRFVEAWMSSETVAVSTEIGNIQKGLSHRPFNEHSEAHQKFLQRLQEKMKDLQKRLPGLKF